MRHHPMKICAVLICVVLVQGCTDIGGGGMDGGGMLVLDPPPDSIAPMSTAAVTEAVIRPEMSKGLDAFIAGDVATAAAHFRAEAVRGNPVAQEMLGECYDDDTGTELDLAQAARLYHQAA